MFRRRFHSWPTTLLTLGLLAACQPATVDRTMDTQGVTETSGGATGGSTGTVNSVSGSPKVEILQMVEPAITTADYPGYYTGTGLPGAGAYVSKLTLPKNYRGYLYLGGINVGTLTQRLHKVRFTFGSSKVGKVVKVLDAAVTTAPGIVPNTNIKVLMLDLRSRPFNDIRMLYDLYDYRDYSVAGATPVETNRDPSLYCRALDLADDPTFDGTGTCDGAGEKCLYSYAKIVDRGLAVGTGAAAVDTVPTRVQTGALPGSGGYYADSAANLQKRCLPDQAPSSGVVVASGVSAGFTRVQDLSFTAFAQSGVLLQRDSTNAIIYNQNVVYRGPFRAVNSENWDISDGAVFGANGLFDIAMPGTGLNGALYRSKMFPRVVKQDYLKDLSYLQAVLGTDGKTVTSMASSGWSEYMDGCNGRVNSVRNNEHVGSCTATAKIEVFYMDGTEEVVVAETNQVVLQLVRSATVSGEGTDYLYGNFRSCDDNNQCGSAECCFNKRCWSKDLVAQCVDSSTQNDTPVGGSCTTSLDCVSMCCNSGTGRCDPHDPSTTPPTLCNQIPGQFCLSKEWCEKQDVVDEYLVDRGTTDEGLPDCHVVKILVPEHRSCVVNQTTFKSSCGAVRTAKKVPVANIATCTGAVSADSLPAGTVVP